MIVPDINLLVYAYNEDAPQYQAALTRWIGLLNGTESVGMPWAVSTGFVRVISNPSAVRSPLSALEAVDHVRHWLAYRHVTPISPGAGHLEFFRQNLAVSGLGSSKVTDAHIAGLAVEHGAEIHSADSDFSKFPGLHWHNPLT